jgi:hypothetical protein
MNLTIKDWRKLEAEAKAARDAINTLVDHLREMAMDKMDASEKATHSGIARLNGNDTSNGLMEMAAKIQDSFWLPDFHLQSEWLGGDSDNPNNHTLREPNCCPAPQKRFSREEIQAAGEECLGPCQWRKKNGKR